MMTGSANRQPGSVFMQGNISAVMQAALDAPVLAGQSQQLSGRGFLGRQAGQAIHDLARPASAILAPDFPLQTKDLTHRGLIQIFVQVGTHQDRPLFNPSMPFLRLRYHPKIFG